MNPLAFLNARSGGLCRLLTRLSDVLWGGREDVKWEVFGVLLVRM